MSVHLLHSFQKLVLFLQVHNLQQEIDAVKGDFAKLIKADFELIGGNLEEYYIEMKSKRAFKEEINEKVRNAAF